MEMALLRPAVVRGRSPIVEGRRFNGRPAVSKTASGGSNPSAPAISAHLEAGNAIMDKSIEKNKNWPKAVKEYFNELKLEMRRVTWPSRKQVESTTLVVIITVFAFAAYFQVVDQVLAKSVTKLTQTLSK